MAIYSANLLDYDWTERTQVIWVSPLMPLLGEKEKIENDFENDLISYLSGYNLAPIQKIVESFRNYDFSGVNVRLFGSIPGRHMKDEKYLFGHFRLRKSYTFRYPKMSLKTIIKI